jgi:hypothetical protein
MIHLGQVGSGGLTMGVEASARQRCGSFRVARKVAVAVLGFRKDPP